MLSPSCPSTILRWATTGLAAVALMTACGALGAESQRVRLLGERTASASRAWTARLEVRPAPRATPRVEAARNGARTPVAVRRVASGRYALRATFPAAGTWRLTARIAAAPHSLGTVAVRAEPIRLRSVLGIALHPQLGLLIADGDSNRVLRADVATGKLSVLAQEGLLAPTGLAVGPDGGVFVADRHAGAVFRIGDGRPRRVAAYPEVLHVAVDSRGDLFVTGRANTVVRVDATTGDAMRYAGTGSGESSGDGGPALAAGLATPHGIAVDPSDNVVVADLTSVRRIDRATNVIDAIAGSGPRRLCGESGPARTVCLTALRVGFEPDGDFYVTDPENVRLWRVSGGLARAYDLGFPPFDVVVESERTLLVADSLHRRVVRFDRTTGTTTAVVG